jgi:hypothetical protein
MNLMSELCAPERRQGKRDKPVLELQPRQLDETVDAVRVKGESFHFSDKAANNADFVVSCVTSFFAKKIWSAKSHFKNGSTA